MKVKNFRTARRYKSSTSLSKDPMAREVSGCANSVHRVHTRRIERELYASSLLYEFVGVIVPELLDRASGTVHVGVALGPGIRLIQEQEMEMTTEHEEDRDALRLK